MGRENRNARRQTTENPQPGIPHSLSMPGRVSDATLWYSGLAGLSPGRRQPAKVYSVFELLRKFSALSVLPLPLYLATLG